MSMDFFLFKRFTNKISFFGIALFLVLFIGFFHLNMMNMDSMSDCPLMSGMAMCNMTAFEHIRTVQSMFSNLSFEKNISLILFSFIFLYYIYLIHSRYLFSPPRNTLYLTKKRLHQNQFFPHTYLEEAFSNGILNPKPF